METEKYYFRVGIFFITVLAAFVYYLLNFGGARENARMERYAVYFDNSVAGLSRGAPVKLKGLSVGVVDEISFASSGSDRILVTADIDDAAPVRKDTVASIAFQGITGTAYLALENTNPSAPPVPLKKENGEKYPVIASGKSELQTALSNAPELMAGMAKASAQVQKLLSDRNIIAMQGVISQSHDVLAEATGAMREIKMLARTIREDPSVIIRGTAHGGYKAQE